MFNKLGRYVKDNPYFIRLLVTIGIGGLILLLGNQFYVPSSGYVRAADLEEVSYATFTKEVENGQIDLVYFHSGSDTMYVHRIDNSYYKVSNPDYDGFKKYLLEQGLIVKKTHELKTAEKVEETRLGQLTLVFMVVLGVGIYYLYRWAFDPGTDQMVVVKNRKKALPGGAAEERGSRREPSADRHNGVKLFSDVAGLAEVKKDMACIVDFLVNKEKYEQAGAKLPRGIILYGPPGTGKTLLAKAVAGEADVPFIYMSGSEFVEMYVGVGAKRVRELFGKARKQSPCIIFIDEIDAIGGKRNGRDVSGEDRKTINALLTELDGFKETENVIVIGATNRLEDLDPALIRPGRFTNKYCVPLPETMEERLEIIRIYGKNKRFDETVDLLVLAKETVGFSPAKLEALLNEASIISVQEGSFFITKAILEKAMYKLLLQGHMKEGDSQRTKEEAQVVAWHEAGHAVLGYLFGKEITKVTIIPSTTGAGGVTFRTVQKTRLHSALDIEQEVMELYGGRLAEFLFYQEDRSKITTGASNDLERASRLIRSYVTRFGMSSEFGLLNLEAAGIEHQEITHCAVGIAKRLEARTLQLLKENYEELKAVADLLLEKNTIYSQDIESIHSVLGKRAFRTK